MSKPITETAEATTATHEADAAPSAPPPPPPPPAPVDPVDFQHVHRKLMRLLNSLEQTGAISPSEVHHIRATP
jgi:hypothetical protein